MERDEARVTAIQMFLLWIGFVCFACAAFVWIAARFLADDGTTMEWEDEPHMGMGGTSGHD